MTEPMQRILSLLRGTRRLQDGQWQALCPAHDDHHPSLSVGTAADGAVLLHCHAGCDAADVLRALGLSWADLQPAAAPARRELGRPAATYDYKDAAGRLLFQVVRYEPKTFRQRRPDGKGGWLWSVGDVQPVLYRLPQLVSADRARPVFVVEGEKDADRLAALGGVVSTTNPGGAGKWRAEYGDCLRGRRVVIVPDNDGPGRGHARLVAEALAGVAAEVRVLELPGLPEHGDASDWLAAAGARDRAREALLALAAAAPPAAEWLASARPPGAPAVARPAPAGVPPLPEAARLPEEFAAGASPWLDAYVAFSRKWSPRAYDGYHEAVGLWVLSTVAARRIVLHLGKPHYTPLYVALVGRTSVWAKSTTADIGVDLLRAAGLDWLLAADASTPQKFIHDLTRRVPDDFDQLPHDRRERIVNRLKRAGQRGWFYEEFGQQLHGMSRQNGVMTDFYGILRRMDDCKPRYEYGSLARGEDVVEQPYLALLASLTPADLAHMAGRSAAGWSDGLWARFAFVSPGNQERGRGRFPEGERIVPPELIGPLQRWHARLGLPELWSMAREASTPGGPPVWKIELKPYAPCVCTLGEGVRERIYDYNNALLDLIEASDNPDLDGNYARLAEKALRVAMLLASLENHDRVELRHWARAQATAERWRADLHNLYGQLNDAPEETLKGERILATIRRLKNPTIREIAQRIRGVDSADVKIVLDALLAKGEVRELVDGRIRRYSVAGSEA